MLQWGRCSCAAEWNQTQVGSRRGSRCFNGAAARVQRNEGHLCVSQLKGKRLQWGRCSCAAEWPPPISTVATLPVASMGPLLVCSGMGSEATRKDSRQMSASMGPLLVCSGMALIEVSIEIGKNDA